MDSARVGVDYKGGGGTVVDLHVGSIRVSGTITYECACLSHPTGCFIFLFQIAPPPPQHIQLIVRLQDKDNATEISQSALALIFVVFSFRSSIIVVISRMGTFSSFCACPPHKIMCELKWLASEGKHSEGQQKGITCFSTVPFLFALSFFSPRPPHTHSTDPEPQCRCITIFLPSLSRCICIPCNGER